MEKLPFEDIELNDPEILKALSKVGVFISDYISEETLPSRIWSNQSELFRPNDESYLQRIHPDDREKLRQANMKVHEGEITEYSQIYRLLEKEGGFRWILSEGQAVKTTDEGKPAIFLGCDSDITDLKETEEKLRKSVEQEKKRTEELETIRQIISEINKSLDTEETIKQILVNLKRVIPYEACSLQLLRGNYLEIEGAEGFLDNEAVKKLRFKYPIENSLSTRAIQESKPFLANNVTEEFPSFTQPDGEVLILSWMGIPLISRGNVFGLLALDGHRKNQFTRHHLEIGGIIGDHISIALENAMLHEEAYNMAMKDALTGLGNRHRMELEGRILFETAIRRETPLSIAMIDIDFFKKINDKYGHDRGDCILKEIARICQDSIRASDLLARFGGEEFIMIMPETGEKEAFGAVERIRESVADCSYESIEEKITVSAGLFTAVPRRGELMNTYIHKADKALYTAKKNGRNRTERHG